MTTSSETPSEPTRVGLLESAFTFSPLEAVCEAVVEASTVDPQILIERRGDRYRWSFATKRDVFSLLDKAAAFLGIDQAHLLVGFRTLDDGTYVLHDDRVGFEPSDDWELITFAVPSTRAEVEERIRARFAKDPPG
ncbi:MAG: hypothetical protein ABSA31_01930 [Acidimicrobiales bacterium]